MKGRKPSIAELPVADLPAEDARVLALVLLDASLHIRSGYPGFAAPYHSRPYAARLLVAVEDLADAAVADAQLSADNAGADPRGRHLHDLQADVVGQRAAVDEHAA